MGEKPLAAYIFTRDKSKMERFVKETNSGSVCINDVVLQITVDTIPFGGIGNSGIGRYRGKFGFDEFSHQKAILKRPFFWDFLSAGRYPPLTKEKIRSLQRLTGVRRKVPNLSVLLPVALGFFTGVFVCLIYRATSN